MAHKTSSRVNLTAYKYLLLALNKGMYTAMELSRLTGLDRGTISKWFGILHRKPNIIYVCDWRRVGDRGNWSAVWALGLGMQDSPKPLAKSSSEYNRRWRVKKRLIGQKQIIETGVKHVIN